MPHQYFAYVVLASLISSQVLAAPTGRPSVVARYAAICDDPALSWELFDKYCGPTMAPSVAHQYAAGVWRRDEGSEDELANVVESVAGSLADDSFPADDEMYVASKRRSIQSIEPANKDLSAHLITSGLWAERHHKADGIHRREDALPETEPAVSSLPADAMAAEDGRTTFPLIKSVNSIDKEHQKREASPVPPPELFEHGHSISKPLRPSKPNRPISIPSDDWATYEAPPIISPEVPHILARQSPGASEPGLGDDYAKYEKQRKKEEKKKAKEEKKKAKDEEVYSAELAHVVSTPSLTHMRVSNIHRRQEKRQPDNIDFAKGKRPIWTPSITHLKWPDIHRREERLPGMEE
ncbi:hypothetical protein COCC4DRAFT_207483 [Bipolaris maydis ATCC 48331]|uniref:Uncharacterized protein n=2 Tax=Cochliobolus heterostrophus TaxID=5016 RepID=M2TSH8_COCH5|nr:uncharacterized protein COCC4DRAFT_207483 [Bipolaris maydis ATCC 48331]EMD89484.1 hypothetical protein COCHEDRAFT_1181160 [Bipolaris maydis C5]ENH99739.1 hypothetical protein COCC4DRAFT_207483 [Bipolaris maydis ATCC 48331]KAJ6212829.1 hypothetical protein PSV09DRAFT_1181160 [Bipolaris maydis]KAJ6280916.1 hypothetical protein J3E71DRAFT_218637 [Bipolaris maydis]